MNNELQQWRDRIADCLATDRYRLERLLEKISQRAGQGKPFDRDLQQFTALLEQSDASLKARKASVPAISYPEELPIAGRRDDIRDAIENHQVVVIAGETGSGKTTSCRKSAWSWGGVCQA